MPSESIVFSPDLDERKLDREVDEIDERLAEVGEDVPVNFDAEDMELDSLSPAGGGGLDRGGGGGMGPGGGAAAAGLASKIPKSVAGVTAAAAMPVALAGGVGMGMLSAMQGASARMQTSATLMGQAWNNVWRPLGDKLDQLFIRDVAKDLLSETENFEDALREGDWLGGLNQLATGIGPDESPGIGEQLGTILGGAGGLVGGIKGGAAAGAAAGSIIPGAGTAAGAAIGGTAGGLAGLFAGSRLGGGLGSDIANINWGDYIPNIKWGSWIPDIRWGDWVPDIEWGDWVPEVSWNDMVPSVNWNNWLPTIKWGEWVPDVKWRDWIPDIKWDSWVPDIKWNDWIPDVNWNSWVPNLWWNSWVPSLSWGDWLSNVKWKQWVPNLKWDTWVPNVTWGDFVPKVDWSDFIPKNPFGGGGGSGDDSSDNDGGLIGGGGPWIGDYDSGGRVTGTGVATVHRGELIADRERLVSELSDALGGGGGGEVDTSAIERKLDELNRNISRLASEMQSMELRTESETIGRVATEGRRERIADTDPTA